MNNTLKKIFDFLVLCIAVLAAIGGTAYLFYYGATFFGITNLALVAMAVPYVIGRVKDILE